MFDFFEVGGAVRDHLLGIESKDVDFSCVARDPDLFDDAQEAFHELQRFIEAQGFTVFLSQPEFLTLRAQVPQGHLLRQRTRVADFVLARLDGPSSDGRRPDWVKPGSLEDDLNRRDFTVNAMAINPVNGQLIDLHFGAIDLKNRILRFVGNPEDRIREDGLRVLRCLRFSVTKGFTIDPELHQFLAKNQRVIVNDHLRSVSTERIKDEMFKMFAHDTLESIRILNQFPIIMDAIFGRKNLNLIPTMKKL